MGYIVSFTFPPFPHRPLLPSHRDKHIDSSKKKKSYIIAIPNLHNRRQSTI